MAPGGFGRDRKYSAEGGAEAVRRLLGTWLLFFGQTFEKGFLCLGLRPARSRVYAFGLFRGKRGNSLIHYRFVLPESLAAGWADGKVLLEPLSFFLAEMA
jgi:hypothetical protein